MIYELIAAIVLATIFLILYVKTAINLGTLKNKIKGLQKDVEVAKKQIEIAANHPDTPASLADRMRNGTL